MSKVVDHSKPLADAVKEKNLVAKYIKKSDLVLLNLLSSGTNQKKLRYVMDRLYRKNLM